MYQKTCNGRIEVNNGLIGKERPHNHEKLTENEQIVYKAKLKIKKLANIEGLRHNSIIAEVTKHLDDFQKSLLSSVESTKRQ
jgi:hypothetical protein